MKRVIPSGALTARGIRHFLTGIFTMAAMAGAGTAMAAVSQVPLFLPQPVQPNIMFTLDNSGSMAWETMTGRDTSSEYNGAKTARAFYASAYNGLYYNPAITYSPGVNYKGVSMGNASVSNTKIDAYPTINGVTGTVNIGATCYTTSSLPTLPLYHSSTFVPNTTNCANSSSGSRNTLRARYAFYYVWNGTGNLNTSSPADSSFPTRVDILPGNTYAKAATRTDCGTGPTCTYAQELQNFANWFSYYRTRIAMMKTAMGLAFADLDPVQAGAYTPRFRLGFNTINSISNNGSVTYNNSGVTDSKSWLTIRELDETQKKAFYDRLYEINPFQGTPLRSQMNRIGKLYQGTLNNFDYTNNDPYRLSATDSTLVSCRASYHIMSTDGYWNDSFSGIGNVDGDGSSNTLADIAAHYYKNDLRTNLTNNVKFKAGAKDNAPWQHMTTFTIGLGANGTLTYNPNYETATPPYTETHAGAVPWPAPSSDDPETVDDLWHAAVNGRGHYYSARNPNELRDGLQATLKAIDDQTGAAASVGISNQNAIDGDAYVYQPTFESGSWTGHLQAFKLDANGDLISPMEWDAANKLPAWNARNIVTWNPSTSAAVAFNWASLTAAQQTALGSNGVLEYLRGRGDNEQTASGQGPGTYRHRPNKLGDIVNSAPLYVKNANYGYQYLAGATSGASTYAAFVAAARTPMIYVGANDGMLHAFDAATGVEKFAYVPNAVYANLKKLSDPGYPHAYYVDGPLAEGDAYDGTSWKKYLVGSTGAGAKAVFALDITTPASLGTTSVKWEKAAGDTGYADLGYVLGRMAVVRLTTGEWAVVFGNGYESASNNSVLYIVKISDGSVIRSITVGTASGGLGTPALLFNNKRELVAAYAGDLGGNLWKFDLSATNSATWSGSKLFAATDNSTPPKAQPIVQKPIIGVHPYGGYLVTVGTGKFFEAADKTSTDVQTLYGIWDKPATTSTVLKTELRQQTLTAVTGGRTLTNNAVNWTNQRGWYINLIGSGERVVGDLLMDSNIILLATTFAATNSICDGGGTSQFMAFNFLTGGATDKFKFLGVNGAVLADANNNALSSVDIAGTTSNPVSTNLGKGKRKYRGLGIDGTPFEVPGDVDVQPLRTWRQLTVKQ